MIDRTLCAHCGGTLTPSPLMGNPEYSWSPLPADDYPPSPVCPVELHDPFRRGGVYPPNECTLDLWSAYHDPREGHTLWIVTVEHQPAVHPQIWVVTVENISGCPSHSTIERITMHDGDAATSVATQMANRLAAEVGA